MGFAFFTTPCLKFAEGGSAWCMAEFFDVVIRDVELYNSGLGTDTSEPVPTVNSHVDSVVDSLTVLEPYTYRFSESCSCNHFVRWQCVT